MFIPTNHERIRTISELFQEEMDRHEANGGVYHDEKAAHIAAEAINTCMPDLASLKNSRLIVEANQGLVLESATSTTYKGLRVEAELSRISIQQLVSSVTDDEFEALQLSSFDLFAVLIPRYVDPDPVDIVFGEEVVVPFSEVERFDPISY